MTAEPPAGRAVPYGEDALAACLAALRHVGAQDLDRPTPCAEFTVHALGDHLVRSLVLLAGVAGTELTDARDASLPDTIAPLAHGAIAAWRERGVDGTVAVGRTMTPAPLAAEIVALELLVHGWDVARAAGVDFAAAPQMCEHMLVQAEQLITPDKRGRSFAPAVTLSDDADPLHRLIAFTGRRP